MNSELRIRGNGKIHGIVNALFLQLSTQDSERSTPLRFGRGERI